MEERIDKLEIITKRLMRRANKNMISLITPFPISNSVVGENVEGAILRYMFPCDGKITKGMMMLDVKPKKRVNVNIKLFNDINSIIKGFTIERKAVSISPDLPVKAGDCLEISLTHDIEDVIKEVWISFLWTPSVKEVEAKSFLITELENDLHKELLMIEEPVLS